MSSVLHSSAPTDTWRWGATAAAAGGSAGLLVALTTSANPIFPVAAALGLIAAVVAYLRPLLLAQVALLCIPLQFAATQTGGIVLTPAKALLLLSAAGWLAGRLLRGGRLVAAGGLTVPLFAFVVAIVPGLLIAQNPGVVANQLAVTVAWFFLYQAVVFSEDESIVRRLLFCLAIAGGILGLLAVVQTSAVDQVAIDGGAVASARAEGGLGQPNVLAIYLVVLIPFLVGAVVLLRSLPLKLAAASGLTLSVCALLLTLSRGGFLAFAAAGLVLFLWQPIRRPALVLLAVLTLLFASGVNPLGTYINEGAISARITSVGNDAGATDPRTTVYRGAVEIIRTHPLFGVGTNDFRAEARNIGLTDTRNNTLITHGHNLLLTVWAERGLVGIGALLFLVVALVRTLVRAGRDRRREQQMMLAATAAAFVAFAAEGVVDYALADSVLLGVLFLLCGVSVRLEREAEDPSVPVAARTANAEATPTPALAPA